MCVDVCACVYNMAMQLVGKKQTLIQGKVSGLSAGLVWARSLVCQQVWCGQGLWSVSRSGVSKVSGLSAGLVWARSLVCQQVWCGQGLWSVSRSGEGKVSGLLAGLVWARSLVC